MTALSVTVIVVSHNRSRWLHRCLIAIDQMDYPVFETVVVACPDGASTARALDLKRPVLVVDFNEANISKARNLGVSHACGEILAFIDDDAVPEPTWLTHLAAAFDGTDIAQAGGITLGRNGISIQHTASLVDDFGQTHDVATDATGPIEITPSAHGVPRLHGTNMAFRRDTILDQNGFDPRFTFYLDETDLTLRISKTGARTAFVPKAVVHHGTAQSRFRNSNRTPKTLWEIGASAAVFHRKHAALHHQQDAKAALLHDRRRWLLGHMQRGSLTPDDVYRLLKQLEHGYSDGLTREFSKAPPISQTTQREIPRFDPLANKDVYLIEHSFSKTEAAQALVQDGHRVTVFELSHSALFHRVTFTEDGVWRHTGGIYGKDLRTERLVQLSTRSARVARIMDRLKGIRYQAGATYIASA
ncbi:glycosyltransferase family 2 protein [Marivita sp. S0852]|uniref:glycosyltransferase family 2 protein n=1 Tax=Marivita sp. S0852 TaxID=3373893 RepID=UPI003981CC66